MSAKETTAALQETTAELKTVRGELKCLQLHTKREHELARDPKRFRRELIVCAVVAVGATILTLVTMLVLGNSSITSKLGASARVSALPGAGSSPGGSFRFTGKIIPPQRPSLFDSAATDTWPRPRVRRWPRRCSGPPCGRFSSSRRASPRSWTRRAR